MPMYDVTQKMCGLRLLATLGQIRGQINDTSVQSECRQIVQTLGEPLRC